MVFTLQIDSTGMSTQLSDTEKLLETQEKVLLELEMILTTVKQIDANIIKSIHSLSGDKEDIHSAKSINQEDQQSYNELVKKNATKITDILRMLDSI